MFGLGNKKVSLIRAITKVMALLVFMALNVNTLNAEDSKTHQNQASASLSFALSDRHGAPLEEHLSSFDCTDKIYAVSNLSNFKKGKHAIEFRWIDPHGETRERTQYDFFMQDKPTTKLWAWLELSRAQGAAMIQWLNPAAGLEEFIGQWKLELLLDGNIVNTGQFEVIC